jgi:hypothetical protein
MMDVISSSETSVLQEAYSLTSEKTTFYTEANLSQVSTLICYAILQDLFARVHIRRKLALQPGRR